MISEKEMVMVPPLHYYQMDPFVSYFSPTETKQISCCTWSTLTLDYTPCLILVSRDLVPSTNVWARVVIVYTQFTREDIRISICPCVHQMDTRRMEKCIIRKGNECVYNDLTD